MTSTKSASPPLLIALAASIGLATSFAQGEAEARRQSFEEAIRKVEAVEKARAAAASAGDESASVARAAQEKLRAAAAAQATLAPATVGDGDSKLAEAAAFAGEVHKKAPAAARAPALAPVAAGTKPAPDPGAPKDGVPVKGNGPAAGPVAGAAPAAKGKAAEETIIDADQLIFDGSGQFGEAFKVVIFEDNVRLKHPQFLMSSDKLTAFFKQQPAPAADPDPAGAAAIPPAEEGAGDKLERAIATGREVTVTKAMEGGEPQIAKARKATYFADRDEVMLEVWPQVQRGQNLVIAKSKDTVIILKGEEMVVKGPVRTTLAGKNPMAGAGAKAKSKGDPGLTQIDADRGAVFNRPSRVAGHKEIFFDGNVSVFDPGFDMIDGDSLTAYTKADPKTGETVMSSAVMHGQKVQVKERTGRKRQGSARSIAYYPSSGDLKLTGYPTIYNGEGMRIKESKSPTEVMYMNEKTGDVKSSGGRSKMTFTPGQKPG